jgi:hypothetical protein
LDARDGRSVIVQMDLYQVADASGQPWLPEGFRFSWIAFNPDDPTEKVLMDAHRGKGPHMHIGNDPEGIQFNWMGLDDALDRFRREVEKYFGVSFEL